MELSQVQALAERIRTAISENLNEANTISSLIMPFLQSMGYDVFDHKEVAREYTSDFGSKKGEKVDIAILRDEKPIMLIECKSLGDSLDTRKCAQLFRYFTTQPARIGILTNGQRYLFFSDTEKQNVMDVKPFMEIDLLNFNERALPELQKLTKETWDLDGALSSAATLKYVRAIKIMIEEDAANPTDNLVRFYASGCFDGKLTAKAIEQFRPIVKRALSEYISDQINKRLETIRKAEETMAYPEKMEEVLDASNEESQSSLGGEIITHNTERWAHITIKALLRDTVEGYRVTMRDHKTYCGILLDDNNRKPICRLYNFAHYEEGMDNIGRNAHILIMAVGNSRGDGEKYPLQHIEDIYPLADKLIAAAKRHLAEE